MTDGGVAGDGLGQHRQPAERHTGEQLFHAAVLVAQLDLQVEDLLAGALKAKMAGLDDAGMHRPHRHLVHRLTRDLVEGGVAGDVGAVVVAEHVRPAGAVGVVADGLQPGVAGRAEAELLGDLALEQVELGAAGQGERGELALHLGGEHEQVRGARHRDEQVAVPLRVDEELDQVAVAADQVGEQPEKAGKAHPRQVGPRQRHAVFDLEKIIHGSAPRVRRWRRRWSPGAVVASTPPRGPR